MKEKLWLFILTILLFSIKAKGQDLADSIRDKFNYRPLITFSSLGLTYGSSVVLLNEAWYKDYPRSGFHFFNDWDEWQKMDKMGHVFSANVQSKYVYELYKWSGVEKSDAILYATLTSLLFQTSIELFDGFSEQWGFSVTDFGANMVGASLFASQELMWSEQRFIFKVSGAKRNYLQSNSSESDNVNPLILEQRANELYGSSLPSRFLKDYNAQTIWLSMNLKSFAKNSKLPAWLNIAVGYGADNMYGGFDNLWEKDGIINDVSSSLPRYNQYYIAPDFDISRIPFKKKFWKTIFGILNVFKIPLPALEINSQGEWKIHPVKF
jgi:hypothetical protein